MFTKVVEKKQPIPPPVTSIPLPGNQQKYKDLSSNLKSSSTVLGSGDLPYDSSDNTVLWRYNIPTLVPGERRRILQILSMTALLVNYQSAQFPLKLGLQATGVNGYQSLKFVQPTQQTAGGWYTLPTDIVCWSLAKAISPVKETATTAYNVAYQIGEEQTWQLGMSNTLELRIQDSDFRRIAGPFNNPIQLHIRILHLGQ